MGLLKATLNGINIKLRLNKDLQYVIIISFINPKKRVYIWVGTLKGFILYLRQNTALGYIGCK